MFDILVNDQVVAVCAEGVVKVFLNALVNALPNEMNVSSRKHVDTPQEAPAEAK